MTTIPAALTRIEVAIEWVNPNSAPMATYTQSVALQVGTIAQTNGLNPYTVDSSGNPTLLPFAELYSNPGHLINQWRLQITTVVNPATPMDLSVFNAVIGKACQNAAVGIANGQKVANELNAQTNRSVTLTALDTSSNVNLALSTVVPPTDSGAVYMGPMGDPGGSWQVAQSSPFPSAIFANNTDGTPAAVDPSLATPGSASNPQLLDVDQGGTSSTDDGSGTATSTASSSSTTPWLLLGGVVLIGGGVVYAQRRGLFTRPAPAPAAPAASNPRSRRNRR